MFEFFSAGEADALGRINSAGSPHRSSSAFSAIYSDLLSFLRLYRDYLVGDIF
jgi:hypothetical protein